MDEPRSSNAAKPDRTEAPVKVGPGATRPGPLGRPVAIVLACALALVAVVWAATEYWGEAQDGDVEETGGGTVDQPAVTEPAPTPSTDAPATSAPSQSDPAGSAPTESDPTPPSSTGGDSQSTTPDGTLQTPAAPQQ